MSSPLIVIVGPTGSGKSALAMEIARTYNGEIIAADSRTIYKDMDIGTAKPTEQDRQVIRHHLIDIRSPDESFSAAEFKQLAIAAIEDIAGRGKVPILAGGTGLYVDAVIFDYRFGPAADADYRAALHAKTIEELQAICRESNINLPLNERNRRHLVRAIELGGLLEPTMQLRQDTLVVGISTEKENLRDRIEHRARQMVAAGIVDEVTLLGTKYQWRGEALKGNIYRVFRGVVEGTKPIDVAVSEFIQSDMNLAKRQMTWFKRNPHIVWSAEPRELLKAADTFLRCYR